MSKIEWTGPIPESCDLCGKRTSLRKSFVDGAMRGRGGWAIMCLDCFFTRGVGLGIGRGQHFAEHLTKPGVYIKVDG